MTLATAVLALMGSIQNPNCIYPLAGCFPVIVFWIMDAQYLRLGRLFRHLYDAARQDKIEEPFSMDIEPFKKIEKHTLRIAFSWSVCWFYSSILAAFILTASVFIK